MAFPKKLKFLKIVGKIILTVVASGGLTSTLIESGVKDPRIIGLASSSTALAALFAKSPRKEKEE